MRIRQALAMQNAKIILKKDGEQQAAVRELAPIAAIAARYTLHATRWRR
jgi:hypothetical protein